MPYFYELTLAQAPPSGYDQKPCHMSYEMNMAGVVWTPAGGKPKGKMLAWQAPTVVRIQSEYQNFITFPAAGWPEVRGKLTIDDGDNPSFDVVRLQAC